MRLTLKPLLYPQASSPHRIKFLHSPSVAPLFSWSYNLLFSQPLSFDEHLRCPPGVGSALHSEFSFPSASAATRLFSMVYRLLDSLASLFRVPFLCFQQLADSFCKMPGVGYPSSISQDSAIQIPAIKISKSSMPSPNPPDVPTFRHSAKIQPTSL